ncbi:hypothetical protein DUNSADRAFT_2911 [Dunaliella salina]|uniref:Encoded protein n=1 Tax=Dunaliella salina TaxID=3046 RepID=A0ABQ7FVT5_DUNSA|nr:hypothetical protein DUNSADRAFT_2911 [Dunaliella salina]|eukprot:KAF5826494.1 hypothetical protein DUNSADRAFT_2911 [Dunaliella salina]
MLAIQKQTGLGVRPRQQVSRRPVVSCRAQQVLPNVQEARDWIARFKSKQQQQAAAPSSNGAPSTNGAATIQDAGSVISYTAEQLQDAKAAEAALAKVKANC